jgi:hypothetical protein
MDQEVITINPAKIEERIAQLEADIARLRDMLKTVRQLRRLGLAMENLNRYPTNGEPDGSVGRPRGKNPHYEVLLDFVSEQTGEITSDALRKAAGEITRNYLYRAAIEQLVDDDYLRVKVKPLGRRIGIYTRTEASHK